MSSRQVIIDNYTVIGKGGCLDMTEAKYTASDIAKWFLYYNNLQMEEADADPITNLKLQKLLYYAQCLLWLGLQ